MVPAGDLAATWAELDAAPGPEFRWVRRPAGDRVAVLLGAFDPPTRAHLAILRAAAGVLGASGAFCLTTVLHGRGDPWLPGPVRLQLTDDVAGANGLGVAVCNRGTYLEVASAAAPLGAEASFVIGSDKLDQLADPSHYSDGHAGVAATFRNVRFVVVRRAGSDVTRPVAAVLDPSDVFDDAGVAAISASEVRRRVAAGETVDGLVPPEVGETLRGYTEPSETR